MPASARAARSPSSSHRRISSAYSSETIGVYGTSPGARSVIGTPQTTQPQQHSELTPWYRAEPPFEDPFEDGWIATLSYVGSFPTSITVVGMGPEKCLYSPIC